MFCAHILVHMCLYFFNIYTKIVIKLLRDRVCASSILLDSAGLFSKYTMQVFYLNQQFKKAPFVSQSCQLLASSHFKIFANLVDI